MKFAIVSAGVEHIPHVKEVAQKLGFIYDEKAPDFVISYGGDGTFLRAERLYPCVPKLPTRKSRVCKKCNNHSLEEGLQALLDNNIIYETLPKLHAHFTVQEKDHNLIGVNDIVIRNVNPAKALRFSLKINDRELNSEFIGDGIVVATPFGSTAYYQSITNSSFSDGIGLAFNNLTEYHAPLKIEKGDTVFLKVIRGPAHITADNFSSQLELYEQQEIKISLATSCASIIRIK